jgi:hypothetical protein
MEYLRRIRSRLNLVPDRHNYRHLGFAVRDNFKPSLSRLLLPRDCGLHILAYGTGLSSCATVYV